MEIKKDLFYIGVNDYDIDLFEGQYKVEKGMAYNSYVIMDEKIAVFDTVEIGFEETWLKNLKEVLNGKEPDYLIVSHMEPDHSSNISLFMDTYKNAVIVSNPKSFNLIKQFYKRDFSDRKLEIVDGSTLSLGKHELIFIAAPMVHWPEVMMTYDKTGKTLFSADGFGKFGTTDADEDWACEARRYYFGIVGKYGMQVQNVLKKAAALDIETICPLHGPVLKENLSYYINLYDTWSSYKTETEGVFIAYTSVYGHTKEAAYKLLDELKKEGCPKVAITDLARDDMAEAVEDAFRYGKIVLATTTYNMEIFPFMREFINHLTERNFQNKKIGIIENGSWAPMAAKVIKTMLEKCKNLTFTETNVKILSALSPENENEIKALAKELI